MLSRDLLMSVFSMDVYNRGYNAGLNDSEKSDTNVTDPDGLGEGGFHLGTATIRGVSLPDGYHQAGFYAAAYDWNGQTIISYRGTDGGAAELALTDLPIARGDSFDVPSVHLAYKFYSEVAELTPEGTKIVTVGHSLGGALAGFVGAITGSETVAVDPIDFVPAVQNFEKLFSRYLTVKNTANANSDFVFLGSMSIPETNGIVKVFPTVSFAEEQLREFGINANQVEEIINKINPITSAHQDGIYSSFYLSGSIAVGARENDATLSDPTLGPELPDIGGIVGPIDAHSASLNVIVKYVEDQLKRDDGAAALDFAPIINPLFDALFNDDVARAAGFSEAGVRGRYSPAEKMGAAIAYSALDDGERPSGDVAIRAMFHDANLLGSLKGKLTDDQTERLAETVVQFAGVMANNDIEFSGSASATRGDVVPGELRETFGALQLTNDNTLLTIDFSNELWGLGDKAQPDILWKTDIWIDAGVTGGLARADVAEALALAGVATNDIQHVHWAMADAASFTLATPIPANPADDSFGIFVTPDAADAQTVMGTGDNDIIVAGEGSGDRTLNGGEGRNIIVGGDGNDTLSAGSGNDVLTGGFGDDELSGGGGGDILDGQDGDDHLNGGLGIDLLDGGGGDDYIAGGQGNDYIDGGEGTDVAVFDGLFTDYVFYRSGDSSLVVQAKQTAPGRSGIDTLTGIEILKFNDQTLSASNLTDERPVDDSHVALTLNYNGTSSWTDPNHTGLAYTQFIKDNKLDMKVSVQFELNSENPMYLPQWYTAVWQHHKAEVSSLTDIHIKFEIEGIQYDLKPAHAAISVDFLEPRSPEIAAHIIEQYGPLAGYEGGNVKIFASFEEPLPIGDFFMLSQIDVTSFFSFPAGVVPYFELGDNWSYNGFFDWNDWFSSSQGANATVYGRLVDPVFSNQVISMSTSGQIDYAPQYQPSPNVFSIRAATPVIVEGGQAEFIVTRSKIGNTDSLQIAYDSGLDDWDLAPQYVKFEPGEYEARFKVVVVQERVSESQKTIVARIATTDSEAQFDKHLASVTVLDDDQKTSGASPDSVSGLVDNEIVIDVLKNDRAVDGNQLQILAGSDNSGGTVLIESGKLLYKPPLGLVGKTQIFYLAVDEAGNEYASFVDVSIRAPGGSGDDIIRGEGSDDLLDGVDGNDSLYGEAGDDILLGEAGDDSLYGGFGSDTVSGDAGDDRIFVYHEDGADQIDGGDGTDFLLLSRYGSNTAFDLSLANPSSKQTLADGTSIVNVERIEFYGGNANDTVTGGKLADILYGNGGNDVVSGGGGDDRIIVLASDGVDTIDGGEGTDHLLLSRYGSETAFNLSLADPSSKQTLADGTSIVNVEQIEFYGGNVNDTVTGGKLADILFGNGGDDVLEGSGGDDQIVGGDGNDVALYRGRYADYTITAQNDGTFAVASQTDGKDTVSFVEKALFADGSFDFATKAFTSTQAPLPTMVLTNATVSENSAIGTVIGRLASSDHAADWQFSLLDGTLPLSIVGNELRVAGGIDFEATETLAINIRAVNKLSGQQFDQNLSVRVLDVNETGTAPGFGFSNGSTNQGAAPGGAVRDLGGLASIRTDGAHGALVENTGTWNALKNAFVADWQPALGSKLTIANFVDVRLDFADLSGKDFDITTIGAKRGGIETGDGDDSVTWFFHSNDRNWVNKAMIETGAGDDRILVSDIAMTGIDDALLQSHGKNGAMWNTAYDGRFSTAQVNGGAGNDIIEADAGTFAKLFASGGTGSDTLTGGRGNDRLEGGAGNDLLTGRSGSDLFVFGKDDGDDTIADFDFAEGDRISLRGGTADDLTLAGNQLLFGGTSITAANGHLFAMSDLIFA